MLMVSRYRPDLKSNGNESRQGLPVGSSRLDVPQRLAVVALRAGEVGE